MKRSEAHRIDFLDGFRGVAILIVIAFHYFSRFADDPRSMYPFGDVWSEFFLFEYGYYGVHLFFAVSGFVISLTLIRCSSPVEFIVRRFARLWPTMLVCSSITFLFLTIFPTYWPQRLQNFLPSLTFIPGELYERVIPGLTLELDFIDGAYWSLFVEVRFYAIAAIVYFLSPQSFVRNFLGLSILVLTLEALLEYIGAETLASLVRVAVITDYLPWFLLGIGAHCLALGNCGAATAYSALSLTALAVDGLASDAWGDFIVSILVIGSFLACIYVAAVRRLFSAKWLTGIGVASYSLYLLHQFIGVTATASVSLALSLSPGVSLFVPFLTAAILIMVSRLIYQYRETPLNNWIVQNFMRRWMVSHVAARPAR